MVKGKKAGLACIRLGLCSPGVVTDPSNFSTEKLRQGEGTFMIILGCIVSWDYLRSPFTALKKLH